MTDNLALAWILGLAAAASLFLLLAWAIATVGNLSLEQGAAWTVLLMFAVAVVLTITEE